MRYRLKTTVGFLSAIALVLGVAVLTSTPADAKPMRARNICHLPQGDEEHSHVIFVGSAAAIVAHERHGDCQNYVEIEDGSCHCIP